MERPPHAALKTERVDVEQLYVLTPITNQHEGRPVKWGAVFLS